MRARYSGLLSVCIGTLLGYPFGVRRGDPWLGGVLAVVSAIAGYGFLVYPGYRTRWSGAHSRFWYTLIGGLTPLIVLLTPNSRLLSDGFPVIVLLGGIWLGGVYAGVALERESSSPADR